MTYSSALTSAENEICKKLKLTGTALEVSKDQALEKVSRSEDIQRNLRKEHNIQDLFNRSLSPLVSFSKVVDAVTDKVTTPVAFANNHPVDLMFLQLKCARFNKNVLRIMKAENIHQGIFISPATMSSYQEIVELVDKFNKKSTGMQVQVESRAFAFEVVFVLALKFAATSIRSLPAAEADAMFANIKYQTSKRNNNSQRGNPSKRNRRS